MNNTSKQNEDGFTYVSHKGKKKNYKQPFCLTVPEPLKNLTSIVYDIQDELKCSDFIVNFKEDLLNVLQEWGLDYILTECFIDNPPNSRDKHSCMNNDDAHPCVNNDKPDIDIVCYGLGQFSSCIISRYQLGFLLVLKSILLSSNVFIYDPQFSIEEIDFLSKLGLNFLGVNEEAKRKLRGKTVCFLPHCDLPLYNNLLWANWSVKHLSEVMIIGNSFQSYEMNDAKSQLQTKAKYVYLANKFATEVKMTNNFRFTDIFNDLSIHYFKSSSLAIVESYVWTDLNEPEYSDDDIIKSC